ncbi:MAG: antimicrobial resistance protein Mig-14 [Cycloclasticus sp.]|nr:antimicrobial resistance protein Mig-14 [Cycloclasticus sp.]
MRSFFQNRRMQGWIEVDQAVYASAYEKFDGSVLSHPMVLNAIEEIVELPIQYFAYEKGGVIQASIPVWKKWIAGSKEGLKKMSRKGMVDFGNAELILPMSSEVKLDLPVSAGNLSSLHHENIRNLKKESIDICLAKPHGFFSKKFRYNRKRELRLLEEQGASVRTIDHLSNEDISQTYIRLFELRWGFKPMGYGRLKSLLEYLRPLLFGSLIEIDGVAIALQLIYKVENASHLSMEYINGGVDSGYKALSPGSVLTYLNTQDAWALSDDLGKPLRYSFGHADNEYKDRWCSRSPVYSV